MKRWVAVSMGDPSGIGPEVTLRALGRRGVPGAILIGDPAVYAEAAGALGMRIRLAEWEPPAPLPRDAVPVRVVARLGVRDRRPGKPTGAGARAAHAAIVEAARLVRDGIASALVTAPIAKATLGDAGLGVTGHTEFLADLCGGVPVRMMMVGPRLRVVLVTTHLALAEVPAALSEERIAQTIRIADGAMRTHFGIERPRLGIAGLNPHAGEHGAYGDEEIRLIAPAVRALRRSGIDAQGPLAADSLFPLALAGRFDAVICMYHDQGLAPFKLLHFADGVNFTLGLPFVRTSPDHGTAYDIAGQGNADPTSMCAAFRLAGRLSATPRRR